MIKELALSEAQVKLLSSNFKFYHVDSKQLLKVNCLNPRGAIIINEIVMALYKTLGLDIMMTSVFTL